MVFCEEAQELRKLDYHSTLKVFRLKIIKPVEKKAVLFFVTVPTNFL